MALPEPSRVDYNERMPPKKLKPVGKKKNIYPNGTLQDMF